MYQIEDFNICSSSADSDIFFNDEFRTALTMAINHQLDKYNEKQLQNGTYKELEPHNLTLYFYPETVGYWFEIKDRRINPTICLMDSLQDWLEVIEKVS